MNMLAELKKAVEVAENHFNNANQAEIEAAAHELKAAEIRLNNFFKGIKKEAL